MHYTRERTRRREKRSAVGTHCNADYLLKNMSSKYNKYVVTENANFLMISVSENYVIESEWAFLFLRQGISWSFFFMKQRLANCFNLSFSL
jgi:hypothetical protein